MGRPPKPIDPSESLTALYGWKIRSLREARGWTQAELGKRIALSDAVVSTLELGKSAPDKRTGELLDETFGTETYFTDHAPLVRKERIPASARCLAQSEENARTLRIYEPCLITGLFQTEDYIRALATAGLRAAEVEEIVSERKRRQEILERETPPRIILVSDEAALRRPVGGTEVFKAQLDRLIELAALPNVVIQSVSSETTAYAGLSAGFVVMSFVEEADVAFVDGPGGLGQFVDDPGDVDRLMHTYDLIRSAALPAMDTMRLIHRIRESL